MDDCKASEVKRRLSEFLRYIGSNNNQFVIKMGYASTFLNSKGGISEEKLGEIFKAYPDLDMNWLFSGEGEMIRQNVNQTNEHGDNINAGRDISLDKSVKSNIDPKYVDKLEKDNERMIQEILKLKDDLLKSRQTIIDLLQKK